MPREQAARSPNASTSGGFAGLYRVTVTMKHGEIRHWLAVQIVPNDPDVRAPGEYWLYAANGKLVDIVRRADIRQLSWTGVGGRYAPIQTDHEGEGESRAESPAAEHGADT